MDAKCMLLLLMLVTGATLTVIYSNDTQIDQLHTKTEKNGNEEEVTILDQNNNVVGIVEIFENEGFQIDKPVGDDEEPCFLRKIDLDVDQSSTNDSDICYVRRAVSYEETIELGLNATHVFNRCRSLFVLEPQDCNVIDDKTAGDIRKKRSWPVGNYCCYYKEYTSVRCVEYEYSCCIHFIFCFHYCTRCVSYSYRYVTVKICHYG